MKKLIVLGAAAAALILPGSASAVQVTLGQLAPVGYGDVGNPGVEIYRLQAADVSGGYAVPAGNWKLTSFSTRGATSLATSSCAVAAVVARPIGGGKFSVVGTSPEALLDPALGSITTGTSNLVVKTGDRIGIWLKTSDPTEMVGCDNGGGAGGYRTLYSSPNAGDKALGNNSGPYPFPAGVTWGPSGSGATSEGALESNRLVNLTATLTSYVPPPVSKPKKAKCKRLKHKKGKGKASAAKKKKGCAKKKKHKKKG